ncbi:26S proteasome non-ATPase regulatory subunit 5-like isoform X2 [Hibiscus syriacus]|uniref:26S proteasome non-ATPase regulatory subunit 5-like isoform X2 n=1 Tax=Hibiscus syriacus TaxID=106335 RepID=A0A6A2ZM96_HIBSY|nr:26S proteasome non-ATPase regulatory subunit 5-like isoform X2 [Hibiscus syriacus]
MEEEFSFHDPTQLLDSASEFAHHPGAQNDAAVKVFLDRFPLPLLCSALQTKADVPGLENTLVACLERVFKTKYGTSLVPQYMPFVQVGLKADSQIVRCLSCKTVLFFLENFDDKSLSAVKLIMDYDVYPLLLDCLINGNEQVATAAIDAIKTLAQFPEAMGIIFPSNINDVTHLGNVASRCSSLGRVRVLSLIVKLFSISNSIASVIYNSNLLSLLEADIRNSNDTLVTLNALELLYELTDIQHGAEFLARTTILLLHSIISNSSMESILRSRAMMISGRLLSKENIYMFVDETSAKSLISAIDARLGLLDGQDADEYESALEALGGIGSSIQGALLLLSFPPAARHIVHAAFDGQGGGKQLAALHALGNIVGENRPEGSIILNDDAEESLRHLIYEVASESTKLTPSGLFLSILQQAAEFRLAGYRVITGLVARVWCLMEICSKPEIISIITDPTTETTKIGMEARYNCCKEIHRSFVSSKLASDPTLSGIAGKLQEGVERGPYLVRKHSEATPVVMTAERF